MNMGNFLITNSNNASNTINLQLKIDATKQDISQSYDLSTIEGVTQANQELISCFSNFSKNDITHVKSQLFKQTSHES